MVSTNMKYSKIDTTTTYINSCMGHIHITELFGFSVTVEISNQSVNSLSRSSLYFKMCSDA